MLLTWVVSVVQCQKKLRNFRRLSVSIHLSWFGSGKAVSQQWLERNVVCDALFARHRDPRTIIHWWAERRNRNVYVLSLDRDSSFSAVQFDHHFQLFNLIIIFSCSIWFRFRFSILETNLLGIFNFSIHQFAIHIMAKLGTHPSICWRMSKVVLLSGQTIPGIWCQHSRSTGDFWINLSPYSSILTSAMELIQRRGCYPKRRRVREYSLYR
jgi:hypothetical protein